MTHDDDRWLSVPEAARLLNCSREGVRKMIEAGGVLTVLRLPGTQVRIERSSVERLRDRSTSWSAD